MLELLVNETFQFGEGKVVQQALTAATVFLRDLDSRSLDSTPFARMYREQYQPGVQQAISLFTLLEPIIPHVGGEKATNLLRLVNEVVRAASVAKEEHVEASLSILMQGIRSAMAEMYDLILLGVAVDRCGKVASAEAASTIASANAIFEQKSREVENTANLVRSSMSSADTEFRRVSAETLQQLSSRGREIVARVKKEVADEILVDTQRQFAAAQPWMWFQVSIWTLLSALALGSFFAFANHLMEVQDLPDKWTWQIGFYAGLRVVVFGGIAAIASFCLRMLKGHLALTQLNAHRSRIAKSIPSFLELVSEENRLAVLQAVLPTIIGVKESVIADEDPETVLKTLSFIESIKAKGKD